MRADLESGRDPRRNRPDSLVASVEIPRLNLAEDPLDPAFDRRFYIFTLRLARIQTPQPGILDADFLLQQGNF